MAVGAQIKEILWMFLKLC